MENKEDLFEKQNKEFLWFIGIGFLLVYLIIVSDVVGE